MPHWPNAAGRAMTCVRTIASAAALGAFLALVTACGSKAPVRQIALTECRVPKLATAAQCGKVEVPENRGQPAGPALAIAVVVLPAATLSPQPDPLIMLPGGPGQSSDALAPLAGALGGVRRNRDIVLIDPRGTGKSAPLRCAALAPRDAFDEMAEEQTIAIAAQRCIGELRASGDADPAQYTTSAVVADIDAVRIALGYDRINLWGGSYGTRVAQEYLRRYPQHVRSVVLDGAAPPAMRISFDVWRTRDDALDDVIAACRASVPCAKAHPDPAATLREIGQALEGGKTITLRDPRTGITREMHVEFDMVIGALQPLTYSPEAASLIPELLALAQAGDFAPLVAASLVVIGDLPDQFSPGLHYSVTCAEDVSRVTRAERTDGVDDERVRSLARRTIAVCDQWPKGTYPADFVQPVKSDVP